jgi:hypothetical protein
VLTGFAVGVFAGILIGRIAGRMEMSARMAAGRHAGLVAQAMLTGSTAGYDLIPHLERVGDSTRVL